MSSASHIDSATSSASRAPPVEVTAAAAEPLAFFFSRSASLRRAFLATRRATLPSAAGAAASARAAALAASAAAFAAALASACLALAASSLALFSLAAASASALFRALTASRAAAASSSAALEAARRDAARRCARSRVCAGGHARVHVRAVKGKGSGAPKRQMRDATKSIQCTRPTGLHDFMLTNISIEASVELQPSGDLW